MADTDSRQPAISDEDNTACGLPERLKQRKPSYVKAVTELEVAAMGRRRSGEDQNIPQGSLAERIANNWQEARLLVSPSFLAVDRTQFTFKNSHWTPIYLALTGWDEQCEIDCYEGHYVTGWFELAPAETWTWSDPTGERRIRYYAEAADGSVYDGGPFQSTPVMDAQFQVCLCDKLHIPTDHSPWYWVSFDDLNLYEYSGVEFW
jgi:hypothetical protein